MMSFGKINTSDLAFLTYVERDSVNTEKKDAIQVKAFEQVVAESGDIYYVDVQDNHIYTLFDNDLNNERVTSNFTLRNFYTKSPLVEEQPIFFKAGVEKVDNGEDSYILRTNEEVCYLLNNFAKNDFNMVDRFKMNSKLISLDSKNSLGGDEISVEKLQDIVETFNTLSLKSHGIEIEDNWEPDNEYDFK